MQSVDLVLTQCSSLEMTSGVYLVCTAVPWCACLCALAEVKAVYNMDMGYGWRMVMVMIIIMDMFWTRRGMAEYYSCTW